MPNRILGFKGKYLFCSNFYWSGLTYGGIYYPTSEHAYQAQKTHDQETRRIIAQLQYPGEAKRYGQTIELRDDWDDDLKIKLMKKIVRRKYVTHAWMIDRIIKSEDAYLEETNDHHDTFWGCIVQPKSQRHLGRNELGKIHMELRDEFNLERKQYERAP